MLPQAMGYSVTVPQKSRPQPRRRPQASPEPPAGTGLRGSVTRLSLRPAVYLQQLPRWLPPIVIAALFVAGIAVRGWGGAVLLLLVAAFAGWLALLSWPALTPTGRLLRAGVLALICALAVWQGLR